MYSCYDGKMGNEMCVFLEVGWLNGGWRFLFLIDLFIRIGV